MLLGKGIIMSKLNVRIVTGSILLLVLTPLIYLLSDRAASSVVAFWMAYAVTTFLEMSSSRTRTRSLMKEFESSFGADTIITLEYRLYIDADETLVSIKQRIRDIQKLRESGLIKIKAYSLFGTRSQWDPMIPRNFIGEYQLECGDHRKASTLSLVIYADSKTLVASSSSDGIAKRWDDENHRCPETQE